MSEQAEHLRVTVGSDGRIEVEGLGLVLALEVEDGALSALLFAQPRDVLLGHLRIWRDGCEVAQAGTWRGTVVEWPA